MNAIIIGYLPKKPSPDLEIIKAAGVKEICSVSWCSFDGSQDWIKQWKHNDYFLYNSSEEALSLIDNLKDKKDYDIYAFKLYPFIVDMGNIVDKEVLPGSVKSLTEDFEFLGYDVVNKTQDYGEFECSPLSCNSGYEDFKVNQYCLFNTFEGALAGGKIFSEGNWEPGPYYIIEVYRQHK